MKRLENVSIRRTQKASPSNVRLLYWPAQEEDVCCLWRVLWVEKLLRNGRFINIRNLPRFLSVGMTYPEGVT